ncbi:MTH1187 family thiamine-binding protein [Nocardia transvalensis]|uniref:MTH1187 family thiamine-binding protein n=1 Tax=Nocardia transvalensis TaxID=37333 RepID=UPI001893F3BE|nr:MTH1187 family thiamine-binding protein [Nocardia transvalensis]MBF6332349.1 MTH1187 family thiamine-binding protein [Nocardia transvalensis]
MLAAFSITPVGRGEDVGREVAEAVRVIRESGLPSRTAASFTEIEGEWDEVFGVIKKATDAVMAVSNRCSIVIKADMRPGHTDTLNSKLESVERYLAQQDDR